MTNRFMIRLMGVLLLVLTGIVGTAFAQDEGTAYEGRFTFTIPAGYEAADAGTTDIVRLTSGDAEVVIVGPDNYASVLGGTTFEAPTEELAFYLERTGYDISEVGEDSVAVEVARRGQSGSAVRTDLDNGRVGAVIALGVDEASVAAASEAAATVAGSFVFPADLVDVAISTEGFSTLVAAVQAAGLEDTLRGGEFTVFAPTDEAFAAAIEALGTTAEDLLADTETLSSILTYHVVEGTVLSTDLTDGMEVTTVNGATFTVNVGDGVTITDGTGATVNVVAADVTAFNGVIHVIDGVILPPPAEEEAAEEEATEEAAEEETEEAAEETVVEPGTILDIASSTDGFRTLTVAVDAAGLEGVLSGEGPFTVFAPTDDAFAAALDALGLSIGDLIGNTELLTSILTYHVVEGAFFAADVVGLDGMEVATVNGATVTVSVTDDGVQLIDSTGNAVNVVTTDIEASNGVIHVIDAVLVPPLEAAAEETTEEAVAEEEATEEAVEEDMAAGFEEPAETTATYEGRYSFAYPENWTAEEAGTTDIVRVSSGDAQVVVGGPENYGSVLGGLSAEDPVAEFALFLERAGYGVGEATDGVFPVTVERRGQSGMAMLLDLENGRTGSIISLGVDEASSAAAAAVAETIAASISFPGDLVDVAISTEGFSTLVAAVQAAGLEDTLRGGEFTVFAPTDEAFAAAIEALGTTAEDLLADTETLSSILTYHVVEGTVLSTDLTDGMEVTTVNGATFTVNVGDGVTITDGTGATVNVVAADVTAFNGVIHVIDGVILPPPAEEEAVEAEATEEAAEEETAEAEAAEGTPSIVDIVAGDENFSILLAAIQNADPAVLETLSGEGPFTVFAPDDAAFLDLLAFLDLSATELLAETDILTSVLLYHVVAGEVRAADVVALDNEGVDTLLAGQQFGVDISDDGRVFLNNVVEVIATDVEASNGVVHVIEDVLLPFPVLVELGLAGN